MKIYEEILSNTSDKKGWKWLKTYILPSLIWYLPHPNNNKSEKEKKKNNDDDMDDGGDMQSVLKKTLFWELLG